MNEKEENFTGPLDPKPISTTKGYFNEDIEASIREMSEEEMLRELLSLEQKRVWTAILKYNQARLGMSQSVLFSGDPLKDATNMARHQGILLGLSDLQNAVISLKQEKEEIEKEQEEK